ncbi:energy transducer TonB [Altererythrobacter sp. H2]|uniref:energy transducer TonB n=1 Tax=Altererythrobacter sp. H2 TaxID=3108391 RepID=UPI002B4BEB38|nr:energy transducer TonB [Altererythrobacter sp. H2]WRK95297.1 energy transducer TonB [Altererythrobacter sp. H2]
MATATLQREEKLGLGVAVALHAALVAMLLLQPAPRDPPPLPERMTVNLTSEVGLTAQSPEPVSESRASIAPTLAEEPAPPQPATAAPEPIPAPRPVQTTAPAPRPAPTARPTARPSPRATASPRPVPRPTASRAPAPRQTVRPAPRPSAAPTRSGGSRIGDDFLPGSGSSTTTTETRVPASQIGASARASLVDGIAREIKPHWQPPNGQDVDQIVTVLRFRLNEDGSLAGRPSVVRQTGVNDTNRAQAGRHAEQAIRAVQLAAPFDLPPQYYEAWKNVSGFSFDWKLSQ